MLQQVRDRVQGWIASIIIGLLVITFALWGIQSYIGGGAGPGKVAKVNGKEITDNQLNSVYDRLRQNLQAQSPTPLSLSDATQAALKKEALQQLINAKVLSDAARGAGYLIGPEQLDNFIAQMPAFQEKGQFSPTKFQQALNMLNYSPEQFLGDLENSLLVAQVQLGIRSSSFGLPNEAQQELKLSEQKRDISYAIIHAADFQKTANVTDTEVNNYYQQHQDQFRLPEKVSIQYIELSVEQLAKNIHPSEQELQQYYQDNLAAFTKEGKALPFTEVKNEVTKALIQQKLQQAFSDQSQKLADLTYTNSTSLTPAASALNLEIKTTDYFTHDGDKEGITAKPQVIAAAFNEDVLKNNNNSNPIPVKDGDVVVLRMKDYQPAKVMPLNEVKDKIVAALRVQNAQNEVQQSGQKIASELTTGDFQKISQQYHLTWQTKNNVSRQAPEISAQILRAAFSLPQPATNKPSVVGVALNDGDYVLVSISKVIDTNTTPSTQQQRVMQSEIENNYAQLEYQLYVKDLMKHAKVKIYTVN